MQYHIEFDLELRKNPYKGKYIVLEGIDGSGKTTQAAKLAEYFHAQGKKVVRVREPRKEGVIGDIVQKVLTGEMKMSSKALQYLFSTDRIIHHEEIIEPALKRGDVVISDRNFWSAIVYGILDRTGGSYDVNDADALLLSQSILSFYHQFIVPDHTFYLRISLEDALSRLGKKNEKKEIYENEEKLKKLIDGYDWLVKRFPKEIEAVNGAQDVKKVTEEMVSRINSDQLSVKK